MVAGEVKYRQLVQQSRGTKSRGKETWARAVVHVNKRTVTRHEHDLLYNLAGRINLSRDKLFERA